MANRDGLPGGDAEPRATQTDEPSAEDHGPPSFELVTSRRRRQRARHLSDERRREAELRAVTERHTSFEDAEEEDWWGPGNLLIDRRRGSEDGDPATALEPPRLITVRPRPDPIAPRRNDLGRFPLLAVTTAIGLCLCSLADALSRATLNPSIWILWGGIALIVSPIFHRLCSDDASIAERVALISLLSLSLYAVKMMRDPFGYTLPDEWFHAFNAQQIVAHHVLFTRDTVLPISSRYPGLEGATSALMFLTGMSSFGAGTILIAVAQWTLTIGLFVLFLALSGSWRLAGIGAAIYAGNSEFLYFGAMFSYESLALPLLVVILAMVALRANVWGLRRAAMTVPIAFVTAAVAVTHHLTSYLLDLVLAVLAAIPALTRGRVRRLHIWRLVFWSVAVTVAWLVVVASETVGYISPVVNQAFEQTLNTLVGESAPRVPFTRGPGGLVTPLPEKIVSLVAVGILLVALPFGFRAAWRRHRREPITIVLGLASIGYFAVFALRLAPSAWEVANRTDTYLFIGLGFIVAFAVFDWLVLTRWRRAVEVGIAIAGSIVVIGGAIAGWAVNSILTPATVIVAGGHQIPSQAIAVGEWVGAHLRGAGFAAPQASARTILLYGDGRVYTGAVADIESLVTSPTLQVGRLAALRRLGIRYIVVDRRVLGDDVSVGYGFSTTAAGGQVDALRPDGVATKFDDLPAARVYDSGDIDIYDLKGTP